MQELRELKQADADSSRPATSAPPLPITVIVPARNEARNLPRCLDSLRGVGEVYVIDSQSSDRTAEIAQSYGVQIVQFHYRGGWPKKRQWAMESLPIAYDWILLLDADESLSPLLVEEIKCAIANPNFDGYYITLRMYFLGRELRHSGASFYKLSLFRRGKGRFECRLRDQDASMADMEVHEHVIVEGKTAKLENPIFHHNVESLSHYIRKHDEYSNWEARVWMRSQMQENKFEGGQSIETAGNLDQLTPSLFGSQAQRRRWLRRNFFSLPGSPLMFFIYKYVFRLGFLDGIPGLIYCCLQGIQFFHIKAKIYELQTCATHGDKTEV